MVSLVGQPVSPLTTSSAEVAVQVNRPPVPGTVKVELSPDAVPALPPSTGRWANLPRALVDTLSIETTGWTDDPDDLPLQYSFLVDPTGTVQPPRGAVTPSQL